MSITAAAVSGAAGAGALTLLHESARHLTMDAPRMDILGKRAIAKMLGAADAEIPPNYVLHKVTLAGDMVSNSLYYGLVGLGGPDTAVLRGGALGLAAGLGAVLLPAPLGLGSAPSNRTPQTTAMTIAWYTIGGLAAGFAFSMLSRREAKQS